MLKGPRLKFMGLYFSVFQDRPDKGSLKCLKIVRKSSKIRKKVKNAEFWTHIVIIGPTITL